MSTRKIYIKETSGTAYECDLSPSVTVGNIATDFFENMDWPQQDAAGHGQRAVVEYQDPATGKYVRLRPDQTLADANIPDGATLSIYPESIAGAIDNRRLAALKRAKLDMDSLVSDYTYISFSTNRDNLPDEYVVTFRCNSFSAPPIRPGESPETAGEHRVQIYLLNDYPREAPLLDWQTPLFHPNVSTEGVVCLGQLNERYLPGLGLKRLVLLLDEMLHWRNYDLLDSFNKEAATWAIQSENWPFIEAIGGISFNLPYRELINPENWGNNAKEGAIFKGIEQPLHLLLQWQADQQRPRIQFSRTIQTEQP